MLETLFARQLFLAKLGILDFSMLDGAPQKRGWSAEIDLVDAGYVGVS